MDDTSIEGFFSSEGKTKVKCWSGFSELLTIAVVLSQVRRITVKILRKK